MVFTCYPTHRAGLNTIRIAAAMARRGTRWTVTVPDAFYDALCMSEAYRIRERYRQHGIHTSTFVKSGHHTAPQALTLAPHKRPTALRPNIAPPADDETGRKST